MVGAILTLAVASDLFLPVAGNLRSASGRDFRTAVSITNIARRPASVRITFLERHPVKVASTPMTINLAPRATTTIEDLPLRLGRGGVVGAVRFESSEKIAVVARIFSTDAIGTGENAVDAESGLNHGEEGTITGVEYDDRNATRQRTYFVETSGRPAGVFVSLHDATGREIAHDNFLLEAYEHRALPIAEFARGTFVHNGSIVVRVTGGSGRVYALGLQVPARSGDGYFVRMAIARSAKPGPSPAEIILYSLTAVAVIAAVALDLYRRKSAGRG